MTRIVLELVNAEAMALAQMCERFTYNDAVRFANPHGVSAGLILG
jgi:hypothetical protein